MPSIRSYGLGFLSGTAWDSNRAQIRNSAGDRGTLYRSILGLAIGTVFGLAIAIFLSEGFLSSGLDTVLGFLRLSEYSSAELVPRPDREYAENHRRVARRDPERRIWAVGNLTS